MTPRQHYNLADGILEEVSNKADTFLDIDMINLAQAHALLALAQFPQ